MDADGKNQERLTYFNEPGYPEYTGKRVIPAYVDFMPDGKTLFLGVVVEQKREKLVDILYKTVLKE